MLNFLALKNWRLIMLEMKTILMKELSLLRKPALFLLKFGHLG
jgi:hypothetical protein